MLLQAFLCLKGFLPMHGSSRLAGFYNLSPAERLETVAKLAGLSDADRLTLTPAGGLSLTLAEGISENVIGTTALPLSIATNFLVNGRDFLIPMAIEEASVVAAASFGAKLVRQGGGFRAGASDPVMIGQLQLVQVPNLEEAKRRILAARDQLVALADSEHATIVARGGGCRGVEVRILPQTPAGPMLVVHLLYDTRDAMGANAVNSVMETLAPLVSQLSGGKARLRIVSNLADRRLAWAEGKVPRGVLGDEAIEGIVEAWAFATVDPYRAATHNKGIMNGIDAVALATGNDWRALEAGAHAYAARGGHYQPLSTWERCPEGSLRGRLEMPLAAGIVGGASRIHPTARTALKVLGVKRATELAQIMVAVGLAQNLAALRALVDEGIQRGHMALHARRVALAAGAKGQLVEKVAE